MVKGRSTVFILAGIVMVGAFIWFQETWRMRNGNAELERILLFRLDADSLLSIEFSHTNGIVRCVKENGTWYAGDGQGNRGRADDALVQRMIAGLNAMGKGTTITRNELSIRGLDAGEYGFDQPSITITAVDSRGRHVWLVGRKAPLGKMVYAKAGAGDEIFTVSDAILAVVPGSHQVLRDHELFPGEAAAARRIEVRGPAGFIQMVKEPQGMWRIQQPVVAQADALEVQLFLQKLYACRIERFEADNVSDFAIYGLQGETRQISVGTADGSSRMLIIGDDVADRPGFVYARHSDDTSVFTLSAEILQLLNVPVERFRDAHVLSLPVDRIDSVEVARGEEQLLLVSDAPGDWQVKKPVVWDADTQKVNDLIMLLGNAVITDFNSVTNQVASPEWVLSFGSSESAQTNRIAVLPAEGRKDGLLIRRDNDNTAYQINLPLVPNTILDPLIYKDRTILVFNRPQISKIELRKTSRPVQIIERNSDQAFVPVSTNGTVRINERTFERFLRKVERVEASEYIAFNPRDLGIYGLADPAAELHISLADTNHLGQVLQIGRESTDGYFSKIKGRDVIFYLSKSDVEMLTADLVEYSEPMVLPEE